MSVIYNSSEDLVKSLKKTLHPFKKQIKDNTSRNQRFAFVGLKKCPKLDKCVAYLQSNGFRFNESIDRKINKISRKYCKQSNGSVESVDRLNDSVDEVLPPQKKQKIIKSLVDLNLISNENEDLDFEEDNSNKSSDESEVSERRRENHLNGNQLTKLNGISNKSDCLKTNGTTNGYVKSSSDKNTSKPETNGLSVYNNTNNNLNVFKIPKNNSQNIETIVNYANSLARNTKRPVEAFSYLTKYLTDDQWVREDVMELLLTIAKNMILVKDFGTQMNRFNDLIDKIKSLKYIDDDFWDDIIFGVYKKKADIKNTHQINTFLSGLHDYMLDNKISARVVCTESVIIAYRILTSHPMAKELIDLQL